MSSDVIRLINEARQAGAILRADPPDLIIHPASRVSADLKARLRDRKADILRQLELEAVDSETIELKTSMRRLEAANALLAISEDGLLQIVRTEAEANQAVMDGLTIYTPKNAYEYVTLTERERRMLHDFKRRFGGSIEWKSL